MYNFNLISCDTDAITVVKQDQTTFTKEETDLLTKELNSIFPDGINWEFEFNAPKMIVIKAKNYVIIKEDGKRVMKGSALKSSSLEPALKSMLQEMIECLIEDKHEDMVAIYNRNVLEIRNGIKDIKPWGKKQQLSPTTFNSTRANETKVVDALKGSEYKSGDRVYLFTLPDKSLSLVERYSGEYNKDKYLEKVFKTVLRFETILPVKDMFPNYSLKKNKGLLETLS